MTAFGDTVNLASRLQTLAEPGTVYLSEATQRLVKGWSRPRFAGAQTIKGKAEPRERLSARRLRNKATRFDARFGGVSPPMWGASGNWMFWNAPCRGPDAGFASSMSSPSQAWESRAAPPVSPTARWGRSSSFPEPLADGQQTPFLPFIEVVRGSFQVRAGEAEARSHASLKSG